MAPVVSFIPFAVAFLAVAGCTLDAKRQAASTDSHQVRQSSSSVGPRLPTQEALLAVVNGVTVLDFETDRPVRRARLLVNGQVVGETGAGTTAPGFKVAVIPGATNIVVHLQVPNMGWLLQGEYPAPVRADLFEEKRYGPGKRLVLTDWTEVLGFVRLSEPM